MRFFEKKRPEIFVHSAKLRRDKKTGKRLWAFTLIVTFSCELAESCEAPIAKAWAYISERDSAVIDLLLDVMCPGTTIDFFGQADDAETVLHLEGVDLGVLRLTRSANVVEFWFSGEHKNNSRLHSFMKEFAFTRCWAQFSPLQGELKLESGSEKPEKEKRSGK